MTDRWKPGDVLELRAKVTVHSVSDAHGLTYQVQLDVRDYEADTRQVWVDADELTANTHDSVVKLLLEENDYLKRMQNEDAQVAADLTQRLLELQEENAELRALIESARRATLAELRAKLEANRK